MKAESLYKIPIR